MRREVEERAKKTSIRLAPAREGTRCRHFSFIFDGTRLVSMGANSRKTHPANLGFKYTSRKSKPISSLVGTHSELKAVLRAGIEKCRGLTLVNTRVNMNGRLDNSMPCNGCMDIIRKAGFAQVFYTDGEGKFKSMKL
jgi:hypothetical protein